MRHYFFTLLLVCLPMSVTYADVASIKQAFKDGKTVKEVIKNAVDNGEDITAVLNDLIAAAPSQAYPAIQAALILYPKQKEAILTAGEALSLTRALMLAPPPSTAPITSNTNQTTNTSTTTSNTGAGGSQTNNQFIPVNIITTPFPTNTGGSSVGGGGCTGGTVLSKNPTTGVSRCASRS